MPSGRFFGLVIGGSHPAALAADWLTSAWDQNAGMRDVTPAYCGGRGRRQRLAARPAGAARGQRRRLRHRGDDGQLHLPGRRPADEVLRRVGWDVGQHGLTGAPRVRVLVGAERHDTVDLALRYLGLGAPEVVAADDQGRIGPGALADRTRAAARTARRSCCCRPATCTPAASTPSPRRSRWRTGTAPGCTSTAPSGCSPQHRRDIGTWSPGSRRADSWATDAHKTLNVPYDCGIAIVADPAALRARWACTATT